MRGAPFPSIPAVSVGCILCPKPRTEATLLTASAPKRKYVRRTKAQKLSAVLAADMVGQQATAEQTGIPLSTIHSWMDKPEFAEFRTKARETMAQEVTLVARLAWRKVAEGLQAGTFEPRDAIFAAEKATAAMQLLTGGATARVETVTEGMNDHEREALREVLADAIAAKAAQPA